jgi:hypothetical protein
MLKATARISNKRPYFNVRLFFGFLLEIPHCDSPIF